MIFTLIRGFVILFIAVVITYFFSFIEKIPGSIIIEIKDKECGCYHLFENLEQDHPYCESCFVHTLYMTKII